ncbi:NADPH-dependent aldo-keto reductase, chloroplastic isoform X3 [Cephus cinctus]|uniref:NADPH-dependent aldo-keto reductase, chloroplastic isoform X3 n=1 Tax=Cephus cinctus TaxID=211228 RepID=A0AAJ7FG27_CEPCN|nr:NADPH-dependent aldo-keto reductase, chloroplastic isoform X3 [Cephus cinctus]
MSVMDIYVHLSSVYKMPLVGLGTYRVRGRDVIYTVIDESLNSGYRSFDTAAVYKNEEDIGYALNKLLPKYALSRSDLFITSKLSPSDNGDPQRIRESVLRSLKWLGTAYLDLYLIHWPGASGMSENSQQNPELRNLTWRTLVEIQKEGYIRSIGVSNYNIKHLKELLQNSYGVIPAVNQVECHPHYSQKELIDFCKREGIHVQAYSSLGTSDPTALLKDPVVYSIASDINVSPARVLLKWAVQQGIGIIPKAVNKKHIKENVELNFMLTSSQMETLSNLPQQKYAWDPTNVF